MIFLRNFLLLFFVVFISFFYSGKNSFPRTAVYYKRARVLLERIDSDYRNGNYKKVLEESGKFLEKFGDSAYFPSVVWLGEKSAGKISGDCSVFEKKLESYSGFGKKEIKAKFDCPDYPVSSKFRPGRYFFLNLPGVKKQKEYLEEKGIVNRRETSLFAVPSEIVYLLRYPKNLLAGYFDFKPEFPCFVFSGSGNYHHLSYFLIRQMEFPVTVIIFDAHTDYRDETEHAFDCGSWVGEMLKLKNVKKVVLIGTDTDRDYYWRNIMFRIPRNAEILQKGDVSKIYAGKFKRIKLGSIHDDFEIPTKSVYFSFDLDCLGKKYIETDWGNGKMTPDEILAIVVRILRKHKFAGADFCAIKNPPDEKSLKTLAKIVKKMASEGVLGRLPAGR
ncbi:MAG: arginase family protein [Elusimicrobia bacterium]|nr:arginase family protein [Elusimicrobiota bacterium]